MLTTSPEVAEHMWHRLKKIAVEDVGLGEQETVVSIPDCALCVHTRAGQEMGRGLLQWRENGATVNNELETARIAISC